MKLTFSIPGRIELSATRLSSPTKRGASSTFSIPGRIELSATQARGYSDHGRAGLSVSPVGSSCLQLTWADRPGFFIRAFSIPGRIELSATIPSR